jgi:hypothetical protein
MISRKDFAWGTVKIVSIFLLWNAFYDALGISQTVLTLLTTTVKDLASQVVGILLGSLLKFGATAALGIYLLTNGDFLVRLIDDEGHRLRKRLNRS